MMPVYFVTLQDLIQFCCNYAPVLFLSVFVINCLFGIFSDMSNFGGGDDL